MNQNNTDYEKINPYQPSRSNSYQSTRTGITGTYSRTIRVITAVLGIVIFILVFLISRETTGKISNKYQLYTTPPTIFFAIWGIIYPLIVGSAIYNVFKNVWNMNTLIFINLTYFLNLAWIIVFAIGKMWAMYLCFIILFFMILIGILIWKSIAELPQQNFDTEIYIMRNIIAFYLGWLFAAININLGIILKYSWKFGNYGQLIIFWILTPSCYFVITAWAFSKQNKRGVFCMSAVWISGLWAIIGALISSIGCIRGTVERCQSF